MVLAPALTGWCHMEQKRALATCVAAILPLCLLSAAISLWRQPLDWMQALPYLLGGLGGGLGQFAPHIAGADKADFHNVIPPCRNCGAFAP